MERTFFLVSALMVFVAPAVNAQVNLTRTGCGATKLCVETPTGCDPSNSSCLFTSLNVTTQAASAGVSVNAELSGSSAGYIYLGLRQNQSSDSATLYICAHNRTSNGTFFSAMSSNGTSLTPANNVSMSGFSGQASGDSIQCTFSIGNVNASVSTRSSQDTTFVVLLGTGALLSDGSIGSFNSSRVTGPLNIANPSENSSNGSVTTTATPATTKPSAATALTPQKAAMLLLSFLVMFAFGTA